jgi:hypothetical protein
MDGQFFIIQTIITYDTKTHYFDTIGFSGDTGWSIKEPKIGLIILSLRHQILSGPFSWQKEPKETMEESIFKFQNFDGGYLDSWIGRMCHEFIPQINQNIMKSVDPYITENDITDYLQGVIDLGEFEIKIENRRNRTYTINLTRKSKNNQSEVLIEMSHFIRRIKEMGIDISFKIENNILITLQIPV